MQMRTTLCSPSIRFGSCEVWRLTRALRLLIWLQLQFFLVTKTVKAPIFKLGSPDDTELLSIAHDIVKIWRPLGLALGLRDSHLDEISEDERKALDRAYAMLRKWKESMGSDANYERLAQGLCHQAVERRELIDAYCRDRGK